MHKKIKTLKEIGKILKKYKEKGEKIVHCHGVFDLLHPGHIRHFKEAKNKGDKLVVTITSDKYINKGPGRPAFNQNLRLESIASLAYVDFVSLNHSKDAISAIEHIKPDIYVKGKEYKNFSKDVTGKIVEEKKAVEKLGGKIYFTDDIVFSSSALINKYIEPFSEEVLNFLKKIKKDFSSDDIVKKINDLKNLKVLIIGDAIIDEYQFVNLIGQSCKGNHLVGVNQTLEKFLGGSLIIANHIAEFCDNVTLLTALGENCHYLDFINSSMNKKVNFQKIFHKKYPTLTKKRYVSLDGKSLSKFFETYSSNCDLLDQENISKINSFLNEKLNDYDLVLASDFGNGMINKKIREKIISGKPFLAVNTQLNSGNRGFNVITHYKKADFISLNEAEIRFAAHDRNSLLSEVVLKISEKMKCPNICITQGVDGVSCFSNKEILDKVPAFGINSIDRVGAGDSFFALAALCQAKKYPLVLSAFVGSVAAAIKVQFICNKYSIKKDELCKFIIRLFK